MPGSKTALRRPWAVMRYGESVVIIVALIVLTTTYAAATTTTHAALCERGSEGRGT